MCPILGFKMIEKKLPKYIISSILSMVGVSLYVLTDTYFISASCGVNGIAALNIALPLFGVLYACGSMLGVGSATRYTLLKASGAKDYQKYFSNAIFFGAMISIIVVVLGLTCSENLFRFLGADDVLVETGVSYFKTILVFAPSFLFDYLLVAFVRNDNDPGYATAIMISTCLLNIALDYIFMFPMDMGLFGAALATGVASYVSCFLLLLHFARKKRNTLKFIWCAPSLHRLGLSVVLGFSAFIGDISNAVTIVAFNYMLLGLGGNDAIAAYGVIANVSIVVIAMFNGIAQGLQPPASEARGIGDTIAMKNILKKSLIVGVGIAIIFIAVFYLFTGQIISIFNSEGSYTLAVIAENGIRLYCLGFLFAVINIVLAGYFGAVDKPVDCMLISILRGIVAIIGFVLILPRFLGINGVWLSFLAAEILTLLISIVRNLVIKKRK